jgi:hypothetical protein
MMKRLYISLLMLMLAQVVSLAQVDSLNAAQTFYSKKQLYNAKRCIDAAVNDAVTSKMAYTYYMRGFIYKEIYKNYESTDLHSNAREQAVKSFVTLLPMDTAAEYPEAKQALKFLANSYFNNAAEFFGPDKYKTAIEYFDTYQKYMKIADANFDGRELYINFYQSMASDLNKYFESDRKKYGYLIDDIENTYKKVIAVDSNDAFSHYNLAMLFYNQGVITINAMDPDADFFKIDEIQEEALKYFKRALPYALAAKRLQPKRKEILLALEAIYHVMYEEDKAKLIRAELDALGK